MKYVIDTNNPDEIFITFENVKAEDLVFIHSNSGNKLFINITKKNE